MLDEPIRGWSEALAFVARHHGAAFRKHSRIPYVTHVVAVAESLAHDYPDRDDLIVAGLLHDVVEDTDATFEMVRDAFGEAVEGLVRAVSKDDAAMESRFGATTAQLTAGLGDDEARRVVWRKRREFMLEHVQGRAVDPDALRLKAADAHANLAAILRDLRDPNVGDGVWSRFTVGRDQSLWFYREVANAARAGLGDEPLVHRLEDVLAAVGRESVAAALADAPSLATPFSIRVASPADADGLAPLFDAYRQFYERPADRPLARAFLMERLSRGESVVLVAEGEAGAAIGFVQLFPTFSSVQAAPIFVLNDLFVVPEARRRGAGRLLMQAAADTARAAGAASMKLATATTNVPAQALYESLGWQRVDFHHYALRLQEPHPVRYGPLDDETG